MIYNLVDIIENKDSNFSPENSYYFLRDYIYTNRGMFILQKIIHLILFLTYRSCLPVAKDKCF